MPARGVGAFRRRAAGGVLAYMSVRFNLKVELGNALLQILVQSGGCSRPVTGAWRSSA